MNATRKVINISELKDWINWQNTRPDNEGFNADTRRGMNAVFEHILHETKQYHGFNYFDWLACGYDNWLNDGRPDDNTKYLGDQSRIVWY